MNAVPAQSLPLDWAKLGTYAATPFPHGWNPDEYVLFSPRDLGVHQAILDVVGSCGHSLLGNHFGFTDPDVAGLAEQKLEDPNIVGVINLDDRQAGGPTEKALVAKDFGPEVGTSVAIGHSIHDAISHLKVWVVDSLYVLSGSTNLSVGGEEKQDNELRITRNALMAARYSDVIMLNHIAMLAQMKAKAAKVAA